MKLSESFWAKRFAWTALLWTIVLVCIVLVGGGLGAPFLRWVFFDGWEWMPFGKFLRYIFGAIPIGVMAGGMFTLYEWWERTYTSLRSKIVVAIVVTGSLMLAMNEGINGILWIMGRWGF